jgi:hypothetical protein
MRITDSRRFLFSGFEILEKFIKATDLMRIPESAEVTFLKKQVKILTEERDQEASLRELYCSNLAVVRQERDRLIEETHRWSKASLQDKVLHEEDISSHKKLLEEVRSAASRKLEEAREALGPEYIGLTIPEAIKTLKDRIQNEANKNPSGPAPTVPSSNSGGVLANRSIPTPGPVSKNLTAMACGRCAECDGGRGSAYCLEPRGSGVANWYRCYCGKLAPMECRECAELSANTTKEPPK